MEATIKMNNKGVEYFLNKDFKKAEVEYKKALKKDETNCTTLNNLGLLFHQKKEYSKAVEYFQKAVSFQEKDTYRLNLANSLVFLHKYDEAETNYIKSLQLNPENANAKISLAKFYETTQNALKATSIWEELVNSSSNEFYKVELAKNYMATNKYENALSVLNFLELNKKDALVYCYIGICEFNLKNYGLADAAFKNSLAIEPDNYKTRHYLAINYLSTGNYNNAIKELDFLIQFNPKNTKVKLDKASILLNQGNYEKAMKIIETVLESEPNNKKALQYKNAIVKIHQSQNQ